MKRFLLFLYVFSTLGIADAINVSPYGAWLTYKSESMRKQGYLGGLYASIGNLAYLAQINYSYLKVDYDDTYDFTLKQNDLTFSYGTYGIHTAISGGIHAIQTNDPILAEGASIFILLDKYYVYGYKKLSFGIENYANIFPFGWNETYTKKGIYTAQFSPYINWYTPLSLTFGIDLFAQLHYQYTPDFLQRSYLSYVFATTLYYSNRYALSMRYRFGEAKMLVSDRGMNVFNALDLYESALDVRLRYNATYSMKFYVATTRYELQEFDTQTYLLKTANQSYVFGLEYVF